MFCGDIISDAKPSLVSRFSFSYNRLNVQFISVNDVQFTPITDRSLHETGVNAVDNQKLDTKCLGVKTIREFKARTLTLKHAIYRNALQNGVCL